MGERKLHEKYPDKHLDIEKIAVVIFCILCGIVMAVLFVSGMRYSWVSEVFWEETVTEQEDSLAFNLCGMLLGLGAVGGMAVLVGRLGTEQPVTERKSDRPGMVRKMDLIAVAIGLVCVLVSACWIYSSQTMPQADQSDIVVYAEAYANGDMSSLQKGGYVANYPQQLGLITFMRVLFFFFGQGNYKAYQYFNACMVFLIVFSGYRIVGYLTGKDVRTEAVYLLFMLCCVPMYGYTSFVYGEIASVALVMFACSMLLSCLEQLRWWKLLLLAAASGGMVQFRENTLICVIAFLIVLAVCFLNKPEGRPLWIGGSILAGVLGFSLAISALYAPYIPEDAKPIPALLFVAMGTHYSPENGAGWHDGYEVQTFLNCDCDPDVALEFGKQEIREFLDKCKEDPSQFFLFYRLKMNSQWNAPLYQSIVMNNAFYGAPTGVARMICFEGGDRYLERFMEIYQLLVYGGALIFLTGCGRKTGRTGIETYALMICIYGGFLFTLIWEAKTRYVFPYFMMMLPCAVTGIVAGLGAAADGWRVLTAGEGKSQV